MMSFSTVTMISAMRVLHLQLSDRPADRLTCLNVVFPDHLEYFTIRRRLQRLGNVGTGLLQPTRTGGNQQELGFLSIDQGQGAAVVPSPTALPVRADIISCTHRGSF